MKRIFCLESGVLNLPGIKVNHFASFIYMLDIISLMSYSVLGGVGSKVAPGFHKHRQLGIWASQ